MRKRSAAVLSVAVSAVFVLGCGFNGIGTAEFVESARSKDYGPPQIVGRIEYSGIKESSGLSASECQDVLWTHNDAGNEPIVYAMDLQGRHLGAWRVPGVESIDWESIATFTEPSGQCSLLIADIGDNDKERESVTIYRIPEPAVSAETARSSSKAPLVAAKAEVLNFKYANGPQNAETVLVHPKTGNIYVLTKMDSGPSQVNRLRPEFGSNAVVTAEKVAELSFPAKPPGLITGGSFSPDGTRVMLCDVENGYEMVLTGSDDPEAIWRQPVAVVDLGERKQGEGVSYGRDGYTLYASSEKKNTPIIRIQRTK